ncbi:MAG: N-acetylmuramoyl-L-alanine amidase family protein [Spirochaetota bacterium]
MVRRILIPAVTTLLFLIAALSWGQQGDGSEEAGSDSAAHPESLETLLESVDGRLYWDPLRGHGSIWRDGRSVTFQIGSPWFVVDYGRAIYLGDVERRDGKVVLPPGATGRIADILSAPVEREGARSIAAVFIDPGHGGRDPGTIGRAADEEGARQVFEKDIVLDVARRLETLLARGYPDKEIILSRDDDVYISLEERTELANAVDLEQDEAIIFVSLHANSSFNRRAQGFEVWYLPPEYRRSGLVNSKDAGVEDPDVLSVLNALREEELTIDSVLLAQRIMEALDEAIGTVSPNRGLKEESWYVVRNARMPSVLVEVGFVSNSEELERLEDPAYLQRIANAIYSGISTFIRSYQQ